MLLVFIASTSSKIAGNCFVPCLVLTDTTESEPSNRTLPMTDNSKSAQNKRWLNWSTTRPTKEKKSFNEIY